MFTFHIVSSFLHTLYIHFLVYVNINNTSIKGVQLFRRRYECYCKYVFRSRSIYAISKYKE